MSLENPHGPDIEARLRLMRDGVINNVGLLVSGALSIILVPIMLRALGAEAYGLWIYALVLAGLTSALDVGIGASVTREVAGTLSGGFSNETIRFVAAACTAYLMLGLLGALLISSLGVPLIAGMRLSSEAGRIARLVFIFVGVGFAGDQMSAFATTVLRGLRRFDTVNLTSVARALTRAVGLIVLLNAGGRLVAVAVWHAFIAVAMAAVGLAVAIRLEPRFSFRLDHFDWDSLRGHIPFGLASQVALALINATWGIGPLIIGMTLGPSWVTPYHIGQKFPVAIWGVTWRAGEVLFPAASEHQRAKNMTSTREVLEVGTRWIVVLALPICIVLWIVAPHLLRAWVGETRPETVMVLRLTTAAVFVDALGEGSFHLLWGRGAVRTVLRVVGIMVSLSSGLALLFLVRSGIVGAAWALLVAAAFGWLALLTAASRVCGIRVLALLRGALQGLVIPGLVCATLALATTYFRPQGAWLTVLSASFAAGSTYVAMLYLHGGRHEEKEFVRQSVGFTSTLLRSSYQGFRRALRRID